MTKKQRSAARRIGSPGHRFGPSLFQGGAFPARIRRWCNCPAVGALQPRRRPWTLSVPSVWQQVRSLEEEYGVQPRRGRWDQGAPDGGWPDALRGFPSSLVESSSDGLGEMFEDKAIHRRANATVVALHHRSREHCGGPSCSTGSIIRKVKLVLVDRVSRLGTGRSSKRDGASYLAVMGMATGDEPMPQFQCLPLTRHTFHHVSTGAPLPQPAASRWPTW